jgi:threonine aldolase
MRQAGVIAAAGLYALENNVERLKTDHENAERLARGLREIGLEVQLNTNMVLVKVDAASAQQLAARLVQSEILVLPRAPMRLVTHLDVDAAGIDHALGVLRGFFAPQAALATPAR